MLACRKPRMPSGQNWAPILLGVGSVIAFYAVSRFNPLLSHSLAESIAAMLALAVFMIFWSSRRFLGNGFYLFVGMVCLFAGILDFMHMLTYPGMSVLPGMTGNESIQLKTAGRWVISAAFLLAPLFLRRRLRLAAALVGYTAALGLTLAVVFFHVLPRFYARFGDDPLGAFRPGAECVSFWRPAFPCLQDAKSSTLGRSPSCWRRWRPIPRRSSPRRSPGIFAAC